MVSDQSKASHEVSETDTVTEALRGEILTGEWEEGAPLREVSLAERFQVSRGAIREVLRTLSHEGLAESRPNCGVRVAATPSDDLETLIVNLRRQIEVFALHTCFQDLTDEVLQEMEEILQRMKQACEEENHSRIAEADISFHRFIIEQAGVPDLLALWLPMLSRLRRTFLNAQKKERSENLMCVYHEHAAILSTIRAGKIGPAVQLLEASIE